MLNKIVNQRQDRDVKQSMAYLGVRIPQGLLDAITAEAGESGLSLSETVRVLLQFAIDVKHRGM
jgi:antitoxin component of RelBE/YafQ-DinJ toxin-antitoxin module